MNTHDAMQSAIRMMIIAAQYATDSNGDAVKMIPLSEAIDILNTIGEEE